MVVKDADIYKLIDKIRDHFKNNINNRFIRKAFLVMNLSQVSWTYLDKLTEDNEYYRIQGYTFEELYEMILAAANFVYHARKEVQPNLRSLAVGKEGESQTDKILREMAIKNFSSNLPIFADLINELYIQITDLDKKMNSSKKKKEYEKIPELNQLGQYLVG